MRRTFLIARREFLSYVATWGFWLSLALAGLFFTMLHYLTASRWSVVLRRISEALMMQLPWLLLAFIPIFFGLHDLSTGRAPTPWPKR